MFMEVYGVCIYVRVYVGLYVHIWIEASRCAYKRNIILNSVRQHNHFITKCIYVGCMFRL